MVNTRSLKLAWAPVDKEDMEKRAARIATPQSKRIANLEAQLAQEKQLSEELIAQIQTLGGLVPQRLSQPVVMTAPTVPT